MPGTGAAATRLVPRGRPQRRQPHWPADLTGEFHRTNLTKANLTGAKIAGAEFYRAKLAGARGIAQPS
ncbi:pentapeptide repeat-containing protein [Streptomyces lavendulocolor]